MYKGTLHGQWEAIITFQQLIVLCDKNGMVDMTPQAISAITSIPLEYIQKGLIDLEKTDPYSRTKGEDGKRIILIDDHRPWGWYIVNHTKYMKLVSYVDKKKNDLDRIREKRKKNNKINNVATCRTLSQPVADVAHIDIDIDKDIKIKTSCKRNRLPYAEIVDLFHKILPGNPKIVALSKNRKMQIRARWLNDIPSLEQWENYFNSVLTSKFLTGQVPPGNGRTKPFVASIDFLIKESNMIKIAEGFYND